MNFLQKREISKHQNQHLDGRLTRSKRYHFFLSNSQTEMPNTYRRQFKRNHSQLNRNNYRITSWMHSARRTFEIESSHRPNIYVFNSIVRRVIFSIVQSDPQADCFPFVARFVRHCLLITIFQRMLTVLRTRFFGAHFLIIYINRRLDMCSVNIKRMRMRHAFNFVGIE